MALTRSPLVFIAAAAGVLALSLIVFALFHAHGIVHFTAHLPGFEGLIRRIGWDRAHAVYWHLRHLLP